MKAAYIETPGPPENIVYGDLPKPKPAENQVLVKVKAVAVNPVDTYIRSAAYPANLPQPFVVGCDLAGVVEAVGPGVTRYRKGDRVWGSNQGLLGRQGTFAEYAAVDEQWLYPTPEEVSDQDAAAVALVAITAHLGLFRDAQLKSGESVFVHGGAGGVGSCVIQMARAAGARVIATAGNERERAALPRTGRRGGPELQDRRSRMPQLEQSSARLDVWFETRREHDFDQAVRHLAFRGRIIVIAGRDSRPKFPVGPFYTKDCRLFGFAMFNAPADEQRKCGGGDQSLAGPRPAASPDRPRDEALRNGRRPPPAGRKHPRQGRHAFRQNRARAVKQGATSTCTSIRRPTAVETWPWGRPA